MTETATVTLREERTRVGISQEEIARKLGISRQTLAKYEAMPETMTIAQARALCHCLAAAYEDFLLAKVASFSHISNINLLMQPSEEA